METENIANELLEEANEIIKGVNWKSLPADGFKKALGWLSDYAAFKEINEEELSAVDTVNAYLDEEEENDGQVD